MVADPQPKDVTCTCTPVLSAGYVDYDPYCDMHGGELDGGPDGPTEWKPAVTIMVTLVVMVSVILHFGGAA